MVNRSQLDSLRDLWRAFWLTDLATVGRPARYAIRALRIAVTVGRDFADGQLSLRAMSLVYTTLLSLVPLLAVSFSVLQAFGVHNELDGWLVGILSPLGEEALRISNQIVSFVENVNVKVLGSFGLGVLVYTVISLTQKVESAVNHTWRIRGTRGFFERFTRYLSVILIGPLLVVTAMGVYASVMTSDVVQQMMQVEPFGVLQANATKTVPYLLVMAAFTFVYMYIPNTRVKLKAALLGGIVAGALWSVAGAAFARFVVSSTAYAAIYSSFAIIVLFLIWLYVGWLILLVGAAVAFYTQNPEYQGVSAIRLRLGGTLAEQVGLELAVRVARQFLRGGEPWPLAHLASDMNVPLENLRDVAKQFCAAGFFVRIEGADDVYVPARDIAGITIAQVIGELRRPEGSGVSMGVVVRHGSTVGDVSDTVESAIASALGAQSLRDLALAEEQAVVEDTKLDRQVAEANVGVVR
jgi:membrane protein